ncbi:uncharacterized protein [Cherax quadricarinatus]|uniref:uncharacterized protein isoform X1 n=1 Tax=Cherax quadricarinatus TaxID=27406 RepID=UPI00387E7B5F
MKFSVLFTLLTVVACTAAEGYGVPVPPLEKICSGGKVWRIDGACVYPKIYRTVHVFAAPPLIETVGPPPKIPTPKIFHNVLFIRTPEPVKKPEPIIVPPPRYENIVYVLNKQNKQVGQKIIEVPAPPLKNPQVYFINYDGEKVPNLPGDVDLQDALASAVAQDELGVGAGIIDDVGLGVGDVGLGVGGLGVGGIGDIGVGGLGVGGIGDIGVGGLGVGGLGVGGLGVGGLGVGGLGVGGLGVGGLGAGGLGAGGIGDIGVGGAGIGGLGVGGGLINNIGGYGGGLIDNVGGFGGEIISDLGSIGGEVISQGGLSLPFSSYAASPYKRETKS